MNIFVMAADEVDVLADEVCCLLAQAVLRYLPTFIPYTSILNLCFFLMYTMHRLNMITQLILPRKRTITSSSATQTSFNITPIHRGCCSVSAVEVTPEVIPATERLLLAG
jgi:hypothetical protein